jgi:sulfur relay (sulfurtransferase) complex TusBCD TusD component (DsrE family)
MLKYVIRSGGHVKACGRCSEARGIDDISFIDGVELSNMKEFSKWVVQAAKIITF